MSSIIVAGATGAIGRTVVQEAIKTASIAKVIALTRSTNTTPEQYAKLFGILQNNKSDNVNITSNNTNTSNNTKTNDKLNEHNYKNQFITVTKEEIDKLIPITFD